MQTEDENSAHLVRSLLPDVQVRVFVKPPLSNTYYGVDRLRRGLVRHV